MSYRRYVWSMPHSVEIQTLRKSKNLPMHFSTLYKIPWFNFKNGNIWKVFIHCTSFLGRGVLIWRAFRVRSSFNTAGRLSVCVLFMFLYPICNRIFFVNRLWCWLWSDFFYYTYSIGWGGSFNATGSLVVRVRLIFYRKNIYCKMKNNV